MRLASWILSYLVNSVWQIPLLFAAGWLAARLLRPAGAAAEHRVWVAVLLLQSLLPTCATFAWEWPRFAWGRVGLHGVGTGVSVFTGAGTVLSALPFPAWLLYGIAIAYGGVTAFFAARFVWRCVSLFLIRRESAELQLEREAAAGLRHCAAIFGVQDVSIAASSRIFAPVTIGVRRKLLLLPVFLVADLPETEMRTVMAHEFAHMRRNDFAKNLLYELAALPVSYHPLLWLARERLTETREMVCDEIASRLAGPRAYAQSLLRLASLLMEPLPATTPHAIGIFDTNSLERRLMRLTVKQVEIGGLRRLATVFVCGALGVATCASALSLGLHINAAAAAVTSGPEVKSDASHANLLHVSAKDMSGNRISGPIPKYPVAAKKAGIQGTVRLRAIISKEGIIENLQVVSGPKELQASALDAVRQWKYKPYLLNGDPVAVETTVNVVYSLRK